METHVCFEVYAEILNVDYLNILLRNFDCTVLMVLI